MASAKDWTFINLDEILVISLVLSHFGLGIVLEAGILVQSCEMSLMFIMLRSIG